MNMAFSICLVDFELLEQESKEDEDLVMAPTCFHLFHRECLERWLRTPGHPANECPVCKQRIETGTPQRPPQLSSMAGPTGIPQTPITAGGALPIRPEYGGQQPQYADPAPSLLPDLETSYTLQPIMTDRSLPGGVDNSYFSQTSPPLSPHLEDTIQRPRDR
eukprot:GFYU01017827.1.p1 GENE.GFYU01017827.1~~GFYU01017827.1.p1  ORF type:complete len:162 (-),score=2.19 GFYU01017827.1:179-664(-)